MSFDIDRIVRTLKPEKRTTPVARSSANLIAAATTMTRRPIVPDATVYVHSGLGRLPPPIAAILQQWPLLHCSVALGEIAHGIGRLDPAHPQTPQRRHYLQGVLRRIPQHRVVTPSDDVHIAAGILTGLFARLLHLPSGAHRQRLNDVLISLTARKAGAAILTANIGDFDLVQQLVPAVEIVYYAI